MGLFNRKPKTEGYSKFKEIKKEKPLDVELTEDELEMVNGKYSKEEFDAIIRARREVKDVNDNVLKR